MKILITGANGQLGREISGLCRTRNIPFVAADSKTLDITRKKAVRDILCAHSPDVIINCAAYNAVDLAETEWEKAFLVNGTGVKNLALAANEYGCRLVHYSTDYVFDGKKPRPYTIVDQPNPVNRYGESKLLGEMNVRDLCDAYYLIRVAWVFGKGNTANFASKVLEWSRSKKEIAVVDDQVSTPTYTPDLAKATLDLLATDSFGLYHMTNSGSCSRFEWARTILDRIQWKGKLTAAKSADFRTAAERPGYSVLDNFGTKEVLGYSLPPWQDATTRYLQETGVIP
jgi:dTDP-4-dehydrorhamnose reductase